MRKDFNELSETTKENIKLMDEMLAQTVKLLSFYPSREASIALTHIETACMWAHKAFVIKDKKE